MDLCAAAFVKKPQRLAMPYCIQRLQTDYLPSYSEPVATDKLGEYFTLLAVLSVKVEETGAIWDTFHHTRLYQLRFLLLLLLFVRVWVWPVCSGQELNGLWSANSVRVCVSYSEVKWLVEQHH